VEQIAQEVALAEGAVAGGGECPFAQMNTAMANASILRGI